MESSLKIFSLLLRRVLIMEQTDLAVASRNLNFFTLFRGIYAAVLSVILWQALAGKPHRGHLDGHKIAAVGISSVPHNPAFWING